MKIFLSASIRGGRGLLETYMDILELLQRHGHEVLSFHVADPQLEEKESLMSEREIYERDMGFLTMSECVIAEVSTPSIGVGYEICRALQLGLPVLCLHPPYSRVSAMILGNRDERLSVRQYSSSGELEDSILDFLAHLCT
ncbi:MAG: 2-deoxynucleoside 5-phosphate N-hydrolase [Methanolobus sp.]|jgi:nucleoside 2-deoxyribosyltransferase|nr:2-deoxynucleoside 5-phosphate N-hydrolase [Methanolobus sp.]MDK2912382.1 2-deoxynucleoside 5-phosphate N-hydrolase [Methanolobus sp.]MDN5308768.1 2-deoxynucleoside 5-phosphate N-hydrolase [Methanolobus sp.]